MPVISPSVIDTKTMSIGAGNIQSLMTATSITTPLSSKTASSISSLVTGAAATPLTGILNTGTTIGSQVDVLGAQAGSLVNVGNTAITGALSSIPTIPSIPSLSIGGAASYLTKALASVTSVFNGGVKSLAAGLDATLSPVFTNTGIKANSTITTAVSDPVHTNLTAAANPISSIFKLDSATGISSAATGKGAVSTPGSALGMIGTTLTTVLNRLDLNAATQTSVLASTLSDTGTKKALSGLFSTPNTLAGTVNALTATVKTIQNPVSALTNTALVNDLTVLASKANSVTAMLGTNILSYVVNPGTTSLVDQTGAVVSTNSNADASTANALLALATTLGCTPGDGTEFSSSLVNSSLYNLLLQLASQLSLDSLLDSLTNCTMASTQGGQQALSAAYIASIGQNPQAAQMILSSIDNPFELNTEAVRQAAIRNANLTSVDVDTISGLLTTTGSSLEKAYSIPDLSTSDVIVYNSQALSAASASFTNGYFQDTALTTYTSPSALSWDAMDVIVL